MKLNWSWDWLWKALFKPAVEKLANNILNELQDELAEQLEKKAKIPRAIFAQIFWDGVNAIEGRLNMDFEDKTPGK